MIAPTPNHPGSPTLHPEALTAPAPLEFVVPCVLAVEVCHSINQFPVAQWNALVSRDEPQLRHDFLRATEASGLAKNPRYLSVRKGAELVAIAVTTDSQIDLLTLAAPKLKHKINKLRRGPLKNFLLLKAVACGPLVTNCHPNLFISPDLSVAERDQAAALLIKAMDELPGGGLRVFFEHPSESADALESSFRANDFVRALSLPGTRIQTQWPNFEAYVKAMRKFYRRAVRHDQKAGAGLDIQIERDFGHLAPEIHRLYLNVLEKAASTFEELTEEFFRELGSCEDARLVTAREKSSPKLVGVELLMLGETGVQDLYTGVDYAYNEKYRVYFNLVYPGIALACEGQYQRITTGQTSYAFKSRLGVEPFPLFVFLKHHNPIVNLILRYGHPLFCPETETFTHRVFREAGNGD